MKQLTTNAGVDTRTGGTSLTVGIVNCKSHYRNQCRDIQVYIYYICFVIHLYTYRHFTKVYSAVKKWKHKLCKYTGKTRKNLIKWDNSDSEIQMLQILSSESLDFKSSDMSTCSRVTPETTQGQRELS